MEADSTVERIVDCSSSSHEATHFSSVDTHLASARSRDTSTTANENCRSADCDYSCSCELCLRDGLDHVRANRNTTYLACAIAGMVIFSFIASALLKILPSTRTVITIRAPFGRIQTSPTELKQGLLVYTFMGIPFAQRPTKELRFVLPRPILEMKGTINWPKQTKACPQATSLPLPPWLRIRKEELDEDCLQLNIWTPDVGCMEVGHDCGNRTVIAFFHGGEFQYGANKLYDGSYLAALGDVVVVVPNYRLGALGFVRGASTDEPGNLGIYDQLAAVKWIKANIGYFGGNASRLVLMGHGSGASSVGYHMFVPEVSSFVEKFILLSGSPFRRYRDNTNLSKANVMNLAIATRCADSKLILNMSVADMIGCLKRLDASLFAVNSGQLGKPTFVPDFASQLLPHVPVVLAQNSTVMQKQVLIGNVADEGSFFMRLLAAVHGDSASNALQPVVRSLFRMMGILHPDRILKTYEKRETSPDACLSRAYGDVTYYCPTQYFAEHLAGAGNDVYAYIFDHKPSFRDAELGKAVHYDELEFLLGPVLKEGNNLPTGDEKALARTLVHIVAEFAKTGRPPVFGDNWKWQNFVVGSPVAARIHSGGLQYINPPSTLWCNSIRESIL